MVLLTVGELLLEAKYSGRVFMKFGVGVIYEKPSTVREFREARLKVSCILLQRVNEILSVFRRICLRAEIDC